MDELKETLEELGNEVIEGMGENPMRAYKLQFPYQVRFRLADDDHRTEVTINTISEEMIFARSIWPYLHRSKLRYDLTRIYFQNAHWTNPWTTYKQQLQLRTAARIGSPRGKTFDKP